MPAQFSRVRSRQQHRSSSPRDLGERGDVGRGGAVGADGIARKEPVYRHCRNFGVTGTGLLGYLLLLLGYLLLGKMRPSNISVKALRAGFQRMALRCRPWPVGSSARMAR